MVRIILFMTVHECHDKEIYLSKQIVQMDSFACPTSKGSGCGPRTLTHRSQDQTIKINVY